MEFKDFDLFGYPIQINYQKDDTYVTKCGGITSLFLVLLCLIGMTFLYQDTNQILQLTQQTQAMIIDKYENRFDKVFLRDEHQFIAIGFKDGTNYFQQPYYAMDIDIKLININDEVQTFVKLNSSYCNPANTKSLLKQEQIQNIQNFLCIQFDKNDIELYGQKEDSRQQYIQISFIKCQNSNQTRLNSDQSCMSLSKGIYARMFIPNFEINQNLYMNGNKTNLDFITQDFYLDQQPGELIISNIPIEKAAITQQFIISQQTNDYIQYHKEFYSFQARSQNQSESSKNFNQLINIRSFASSSQTTIQYFNILIIFNFIGSYSFFFFMTGNFLVLNYNKLSFLYDYQNRINDLRVVDKDDKKKYQKLDKDITPFVYFTQYFSEKEKQKRKIFDQVIDYSSEHLKIEQIKNTQNYLFNTMFIIFDKQFNSILHHLNRRVIKLQIEKEDVKRSCLQKMFCMKKKKTITKIKDDKINQKDFVKPQEIELEDLIYQQEKNLKYELEQFFDEDFNNPNSEHYKQKLLEILEEKIIDGEFNSKIQNQLSQLRQSNMNLSQKRSIILGQRQSQVIEQLNPQPNSQIEYYDSESLNQDLNQEKTFQVKPEKKSVVTFPKNSSIIKKK